MPELQLPRRRLRDPVPSSTAGPEWHGYVGCRCHLRAARHRCGAFKVLSMDHIMRLPFKVSTTTSNFMMGVTAAASAGIYLGRGYIDPGIALPVFLGTLPGALLGSRVLARADVKPLRGVCRTGHSGSRTHDLGRVGRWLIKSQGRARDTWPPARGRPPPSWSSPVFSPLCCGSQWCWLLGEGYGFL